VAQQEERGCIAPLSGSPALLPLSDQALLLRRLRLSAAAAARVLGVRERTFLRWVKQGLVPPAPDGGFDADSLERGLKVQALLAAGLSRSEVAARLLANDRPAPVPPAHLALRLEQRLHHLEQAVALARHRHVAAAEGAPDEVQRRVHRFFEQFPYAFDTAEGLALRLGAPLGALHAALETLADQGVLARRRGPDYVYARARPAGAASPVRHGKLVATPPVF
jgi:DNA-binding transcriptional MerR regulator